MFLKEHEHKQGRGRGTSRPLLSREQGAHTRLHPGILRSEPEQSPHGAPKGVMGWGGGACPYRCHISLLASQHHSHRSRHLRVLGCISRGHKNTLRGDRSGIQGRRKLLNVLTTAAHRQVLQTGKRTSLQRLSRPEADPLLRAKVISAQAPGPGESTLM